MSEYKLSPSSLNLLEECPRCFWLKIVRGIDRPNGVFPSLPSGVDKVLKNHFDKHRGLGSLPPELVKYRITAKLFSRMDLLEVWRNARKGLQYTDKKSGMLLRGAVDDILEKDGKLIVLDFKTRGFPVKEDTHTHYQDQLNIYNFLLRKNGYDTEDYGYLLFFHPVDVSQNGDFVFETELKEIDVSVDHAQELFERAIGILNGGMPDSSADCGFCEWKEKKF